MTPAKRPIADAAPSAPLVATVRHRLWTVLTTARRGWHRVAWRGWERACGIDTRGSIEAGQLGHGPASFGYQPIEFEALWTALRQLDVGADDVFVDYGCGKGRALLIAARFPFRRVIGVERSNELCRWAETHLQRAASWRRCQAIQVVEADATRYKLPDDTTIIFFFNPFAREVMAAVVREIEDSLARRWRPLRILYALPKTDQDELSHLPWLRWERQVATASDAWLRLAVYRAWRPAQQECLA